MSFINQRSCAGVKCNTNARPGKDVILWRFFSFIFAYLKDAMHNIFVFCGKNAKMTVLNTNVKRIGYGKKSSVI